MTTEGVLDWEGEVLYFYKADSWKQLGAWSEDKASNGEGSKMLVL